MPERFSPPDHPLGARPLGTGPTLRATRLSPERKFGERPLLVLGPSLGTSTVLWREVAVLLADPFDLLAWDLPGHGVSPVAEAPFSVADLAISVVAMVDSIAPGAVFHYAGVSLGGATGLQLGIDHGHKLLSLSVLCSGAALGTRQMWEQRAATVLRDGTAALLESSAQRWFAPGFRDKHLERADELLASLRAADPASYALCCGALASFDVHHELISIRAATLAIAGVEDTVAPPAFAETIAQSISAAGRNASAVSLPHVGHLAPAEAPATVARLLRDFIH